MMSLDLKNYIFIPIKRTLLDPQNDFLSYTKLQLYTFRIKSLNHKMTTVQQHKIWKFYGGGGAKLGNNCVKVSNLFGLLGLLGILGLLSLLGLLGVLTHWSIRHWNLKIYFRPVKSHFCWEIHLKQIKDSKDLKDLKDLNDLKDP